MHFKFFARMALVAAFAAATVSMTGCDSGPSEPVDLTAPLISPQLGTPDGSNIPLSVGVNENATVTYVILEAGSNPPTTLDVRDGVDQSGTAVAADFKGSFSATPSVAGTVNLAINDGRDYVIYIIAEDAKGNRSSTPTAVAVTASADAPPAFSAATPALSGDAGSITIITANISKAGTVYAVGVAAGESAPSAAQIKAGQNASGGAAVASGSAAVLVADSDVSLELCGFAVNTAYTIYVAAESAEGAIGAAPRTVSIATGPKPAASVAAIGDSGVTVTINGSVVALTSNKATPAVDIGANCVGLEVSRTYNQYGGALIGAVAWNCGSDSVKTGSTWTYSFTAPTGWNTAGFDDSKWHTAREINEAPGTARQAGDAAVGNEPKYTLDQNAKWIWSGPNYYYRKEITTTADSATIKVCGAQEYSFFVDGVALVDNDKSYLIAKELRVALTAGAHCFAAVATDTTTGDWGGNFIMELIIGGESHITDDTWKMFVEEVDGWKDVGFDDSNWYNANKLGNYVLKQRPDDKTEPALLTGGFGDPWLKSPVFGRKKVGDVIVEASLAQWIGGPYTIYFRKEFTVQ